jgi:hypothetical protein
VGVGRSACYADHGIRFAAHALTRGRADAVSIKALFHADQRFEALERAAEA